jgi:hypothetical protein
VNYSNLNGGNPGQALRELTGMPVSLYDSSKEKEDEFFNRVKDADERKYVITAACMNQMFDLVTGHAYTLLGVQ